MAELSAINLRGAAETLGRFTSRFWQRHETDGLLWVKSRIDDVLDFRARQWDLFATPAEAPQLLVFPAPETPPDQPAYLVNQEREQLASVLSPSQVGSFLDCQTRWYYKHGLGLPDPKNSSLALGIAFHSAIAENFRQKIETKKDLPAIGVSALFRDFWHEQSLQAKFHNDEDRDELLATGECVTRKYIEEAAPFVHPAAVELEVSGKIAGVSVRGKVDVLDEDGRVIDAKTAAKSPSGIDQGYRRQIATYVQITPGATGSGRIDTVTKAKTTKVIQQSFDVGPRDIAHVEMIYPLVQEAMRSGLYTPNRGSNLCSQRHCPYWERCEDEYGGQVDER